jgi:hypothetical protein
MKEQLEGKEVLIFTKDRNVLLGEVELWKEEGEEEIRVNLKITSRTKFREGQRIGLLDVLREFELPEDNATLASGNGHKV